MNTEEYLESLHMNQIDDVSPITLELLLSYLG